MAAIARVMANGFDLQLGQWDCYVQDFLQVRPRQLSRHQIHFLMKPRPEQTWHQLKADLCP